MRCPAHEDHTPSLSISVARDGTVLLRCFRGCGAADVAAAIGLELRDLFPLRESPRPASRRAPSEAEIRAAIMREATAFRETHRIDAGDALLTFERNEIRARVALRLGVTLSPLPTPPWEGNYGGRERDPLWADTFERAWQELWLELGYEPPYTLRERTRRGPRLPAQSLIKIEDRAAAIFAARKETNRARCA